MNAPESPKKHTPRPISEEEREAAHRQYLAATAILRGKKSADDATLTTHPADNRTEPS